MVDTLESILGDIVTFLTTIVQNVEMCGVNVDNYILDHLCYRVETIEEYEKKKEELSRFGTSISEDMIGGRPISTFKLKEPILFRNWKIFCVELPSPKKGSEYPRGLEHIEFAIGLDQSFDELIAKYPNLEWDTRASNKVINPDVQLGFSNGTSVKFHQQTLEEVIKFETEEKEREKEREKRAIV